MKRIVLFIAALVILTNMAKSQTFIDEDFQQSGKIMFKVFTNFHADLIRDEVNNTAFEVTRAYLGYTHDFNKQLTAQIIFDASPDNATKRYGVFLKIAGLTWRPTEKLTINGGMISPNQFKIQERFWGYRYIYKSFQDEYKFGYSADLGMTVAYNFNKYISADIGFFNGEGYKNINLKYGDFKGSAGITIHPVERIQLRLYYDIMNNNDTSLNSDSRQNQSTLAGFLGFRITDKFRIAGEYNYQKQHTNIKDHNLFGYSFYSTYVFNKKFEIYGRVDILSSNILEGETESWDYKNNGIGLLGGMQYAPVKGLKLSLNYRHILPKKPNKEPVPSSSSWIYFNVEFKI
jgi:opacity protein-like surface antigen